MDEQFETRNLIPPTALRPLLVRRTWPSALRLTLHFAAFLGLMVLLARHATQVWLALPLAVALAWVWSGLFAPFHECTHRTAFRTPRGNRPGAWLSGIPFGMAPLEFPVRSHRAPTSAPSVPRTISVPANFPAPVKERNQRLPENPAKAGT